MPVVTRGDIERLPDLDVDLDAATLETATITTLTATAATVTTGTVTTLTSTTVNATDVDAGASGTAGSVDIFPATASKGKIAITATNNTNNDTLSITNAAQAAARTYTIPDAGNNASFVMTEGSQTINGTKTIPAIVTTNIDAGASGTAGTVDVFPTTTAKGKIAISAADSADDTTTTITNASQAGARTYTIPDAGASASFVMSEGAQTVNGAKTFGSAPNFPTTGFQCDSVTMSQVKWVDVTVTAALLDSAGTVNVIAGVSGDQYKIRGIRLVGGGTSFGAGGDRLISLTDGTTTWTTIANADIESAPSATLEWGDTKVPFLTGTSDTASASNQAIRFQYSGGTTDHSGTGSIKFSVCIEKVA